MFHRAIRKICICLWMPGTNISESLSFGSRGDGEKLIPVIILLLQ